MEFLQNFLEIDPVLKFSKIIIYLFAFTCIILFVGFYYDFVKNKNNSKKLTILERAIKDLIEEFRNLELSLSDQKNFNDYKYTLERLDQEISRLADSSKEESNITNAIKMANQGKKY